jgi:3-oxoacyl-[acyl-carrier protein] reductase
VELFQECNAEIIATGTDIKDLERLNEESSDKRTKYIHLDFTSNESVQRFLGFIDKQDRVDVLINNAGVNKIESIDKIEQDDWDWINHVNLRGPFQLTKAVSELMKKQGQGKIVNIASIFGVVSKSKRAAYSTTKWGLVGLTKATALDLASHNILVNAVSPGFVDTDLTRQILGEKEIEKLLDTIPQKRLAVAKEIAKTVIFLASDHNTYITGQNIIVDGGFTSA